MMKRTSVKLSAAWVIPLLVACLWVSPVLGEDVDVSYKIVSFYEDVTWSEILAYAEQWQASNVTVVEELQIDYPRTSRAQQRELQAVRRVLTR